MDIEIKTFEQLSKDELYEILRVRTAVFVVEQECPYQEVDDKDQKALHIIGKKNKRVIAYARAFNAGDYDVEASIGRVLVDVDHRDKGLGQQVMKASMEAVKSRFNTNVVVVSAQQYLKNFYRDLGFTVTGEPYLEDEIPHIKMICTPL